MEVARHTAVWVSITEQHWQREDGRQADREHLLMALADLEAILVKATYTTLTQESGYAHEFISLFKHANQFNLVEYF